MINLNSRVKVNPNVDPNDLGETDHRYPSRTQPLDQLLTRILDLGGTRLEGKMRRWSHLDYASKHEVICVSF